MSVLAVADPLAAVCAYLRSEIGGMVTLTPATDPQGQPLIGIPVGVPAIFRPDLPRGWDQLMPCATIVVRNAGGVDLFGKGYIPLSSPRLDIASYGESARQAEEIARAALVALKRLTPSVWENCLLHACYISATPIPSYEANTLWPLAIFSTQVIYAEDLVA